MAVTCRTRYYPAPLLKLEVNKNPSEVFIVLLESMVELLNVSLIKKAQNLLFELSTSLTGNDLDETDFLFKRLCNNAIEFRVDLVAAIVDVVQVEFKLCHSFSAVESQKVGAGSI